MSRRFRTHIARSLASLLLSSDSTNPPEALDPHLLPLVISNKHKEADASATPYAISIHHLLRLLPTLPSIYTLNPELTSIHAAPDLAHAIAASWPCDDHVEGAAAAGGFVNFTVCRGTFMKVVLTELGAGRIVLPEMDENPGDRRKVVMVEYALPPPGRLYEATHWRSAVVAGFVVRGSRARGWDVRSRSRCLGDAGEEVRFDVDVGALGSVSGDEVLWALRKAVVEQGSSSTATEVDWDIWRAWQAAHQSHLNSISSPLCVTLDCPTTFHASSIITATVATLTALGGPKSTSQTLDLTPYNLGTLPLLTATNRPTRALRDIILALQAADQGVTDVYCVSKMGRRYAIDQVQMATRLLGCGVVLTDIPVAAIAGMAAFDAPRTTDVVSSTTYISRTTRWMHRIMADRLPDEEGDADRDAPTASATPRALALTTLQTHTLAPKRTTAFTFAWPALRAGSDVGVYIQYTHARLTSILAHVPRSSHPPQSQAGDLATAREAYALVHLLSRYPAALRTAIAAHEPAILLTYLVELCTKVGGALGGLRVKGMRADVARARGQVVRVVRGVVREGLAVLSGVHGVERM
ncbi:uncharacterized protein EV422DRAFT_510227 [Fimicolochytrium jonesii]|uniref:uncharacterized protein n=1 Tax=Fimicolochytrium jonesii TaxID=1396493 RepID=UPI0022FE4F75|nr:uncharacterized protein EV422DRAFT_510227 [Fimicolochytrium jonesii]KAI8815858.1 hypothetical protein EV422DRAFT_510227 [Fimicolochytrium jonesii]